MTSSAQASRTLLKLYEHSGLAAQIKAGKPLPPQVSRMLDVLTAGTGAPGEIGSWEYVKADGTIVNELQLDPPSPREARARTVAFDD